LIRHDSGDKVENVPVPLPIHRNRIKTYLDCMQTGMHAKGSLIPQRGNVQGRNDLKTP